MALPQPGKSCGKQRLLRKPGEVRFLIRFGEKNKEKPWKMIGFTSGKSEFLRVQEKQIERPGDFTFEHKQKHGFPGVFLPGVCFYDACCVRPDAFVN